MKELSPDTRFNAIPVLHARGSHEELGYIIGRTFKNFIEDVLDRWKYFNKVILPTFLTVEGKTIYDSALSLCSSRFPRYIEELQGMAAGSKVPFYKLFLLHIDTMVVQGREAEVAVGGTGCTTILSNCDETTIGHTEDACPEFLNNVFILSAELLDKDGKRLEKFTTLAYPGYLPGYTMGYNSSGLVYTINTLFLKTPATEGTPRLFLGRAILGASNFAQALEICRDVGHGASDGFSLNLHFATQDEGGGSPVLHNVEVGPPPREGGGKQRESELSVLSLTHGDIHVHCNRYLRLQIEEERDGIAFRSSDRRHRAISRRMKCTTRDRVVEALGDEGEEEEEFPVFRSGATPTRPDYVKTVAVGVFELQKKRWSIYIDPPNKSQPVLVLPLDF